MTCYFPLQAYYLNSAPGSNRKITFDSRLGGFPLTLPCGRCIGCRLKYSRIWAIRCIHEASLHLDNSFVTLTYSDEFLPKDGSLDLRHFQLFMKRLRKKFGPGIRFFHCGEYGENLSRPHYHVLLFGLDFPDKKYWKMSRGKNGGNKLNKLYTSAILEKLWGKGFATIGSVTFDSAAYVARYICEKVNDSKSDFYKNHYKGKKPEYSTMSRRPGIGKAWFDKFYKDIYPSDFIVMNGEKMKPPRYYDTLLEKLDPDAYSDVKQLRENLGFERNTDNT